MHGSFKGIEVMLLSPLYFTKTRLGFPDGDLTYLTGTRQNYLKNSFIMFNGLCAQYRVTAEGTFTNMKYYKNIFYIFSCRKKKV